MYSFLSNISDRKYVDIPRNQSFNVSSFSFSFSGTKFHQIDVPELISAIREHHAALVFVTNPNNPTGDILSREQIAEICKNVSEFCLVVVDEAYAEFSNTSCIDMIKDYPNLVVTRTFVRTFFP